LWPNCSSRISSFMGGANLPGDAHQVGSCAQIRPTDRVQAFRRTSAPVTKKNCSSRSAGELLETLVEKQELMYTRRLLSAVRFQLVSGCLQYLRGYGELICVLANASKQLSELPAPGRRTRQRENALSVFDGLRADAAVHSLNGSGLVLQLVSFHDPYASLISRSMVMIPELRSLGCLPMCMRYQPSFRLNKHVQWLCRRISSDG